MRKGIIFFVCFFIVSLSVLPASAYSTVPDDYRQDVIEAPISFNLVFGDEDSTEYCPWPFNTIKLTDTLTTLSSNGTVSAIYSTTSSSVNGMFQFTTKFGQGSGSFFTLVSDRPQFVDIASLSTYYIAPALPDGVFSCPMGWTIEVQYLRPVKVGGTQEWMLESVYKNGVGGSQSENSFFLGAELLELIEYDEDDNYILIKSVQVYMETRFPDSAPVSYYVGYDGAGTSMLGSAQRWFNDYDIKTAEYEMVETPNMFDWLSDSVFSFFDIEFVPGISIGGISLIGLSVGLILWFINLIR